MIKNQIKIRHIALSILICGALTSCDDPELDALMSDYCECISASRYEKDKHQECIEKMDTIKMKYANQPRKLQEVLEKTNDCY